MSWWCSFTGWHWWQRISPSTAVHQCRLCYEMKVINYHYGVNLDERLVMKDRNEKQEA